MEEINKTGVKSRDELRTMRAAMRAQVNVKEEEILDHFKPLTRILGFFSRHKNENEGNEKKGFIASAAKIVLPLLVGRSVLKNKKKFLLMPLLGYFLKQGAEYVASKPVKEHVKHLKEKFHKGETEPAIE